MTGEELDKSLEGIRLTTETIQGKDLLKEILVDGQLDSRFRSIHDGGAFAYSPLESGSMIREDGGWCSILRLNGLIVGIAQLIRDYSDPKGVGLRNFCIAHDLKGLKKGSLEEQEMKLSERLLRAVLEYAQSEKSTLYLTRFTGEGELYLRHQIDRLAPVYGVQIIYSRDF